MKFGAFVLGLTVAIASLAAIAYLGRDQNLDKSKEAAAAAQAATAHDLEISPTGPYPKAVSDQVEFDFGTMGVAEERHHDFVIKNMGEAPLKIKQGPTTCKCTLSKLPQDEIAVGESTTVHVSWKPLTESEMFEQSAEIHTNDPENKHLKFRIKGRVTNILKMEPGEIWNVGELDDDKPKVMEGSISSEVSNNFKILSIVSENPKVKVTHEPLDAASLKGTTKKSGYRLKAVIDPGLPIGHFNEKFTIKTDIKQPSPDGEGTDLTNFVIQLTGRREGPFMFLANPGTRWYSEKNAVDLGTFPAREGKKASVSLFVLGKGSDDFKLLSVSAEPDTVRLSMQKETSFMVKGRAKYTLTFEVPAGQLPASRNRREAVVIRVKTNHPDAQDFKFYTMYESE